MIPGDCVDGVRHLGPRHILCNLNTSEFQEDAEAVGYLVHRDSSVEQVGLQGDAQSSDRVEDEAKEE